MDFSELKTKSVTELKELLTEERASFFRLRQQVRSNVLKKHDAIPKIRKTIARIMLLLSSNR